MAEDEKEKKTEKPEIAVDDDWKAHAQAEKEKLDEQARKPSRPAEDQEAEGGAPRKIPPASFATLVSSLATQAMFAMGSVQDPETNMPIVDLPLAKHHVDALAVLEEKTKGNLTEEETKLLDQVLYQVRMQYVQVAQGGIRA